ncbi:TPA: hypothetical protein ACSRV8_004317 [Enterobacter hormaechei subsp. steigerwaltii]|uniref:tail fiber/spike domain-containing protein n=1 Tax=Enterobacter hormaechei TaxID=158836 RepID=UPI0007569F41|nr:hypothetical protein [Enterobacter hormaechei]KVK13895.1 hypothetical protein AWS16_14775 [Enterobacter hormaechei subsp. steigerwaltii]KVK25323.1 hypothetical protein AWS15_18365 [Enterobacter hormaechei subsp. steigerwaltii]KZQ09753.1 hypothetical protein A3N48_00405 [Enterobacter hormaechei subsp. steigerwaltii]MBG0526560.1 hypothetical protein [Enterobacter hormaechei]MBK4233345.1 hypothetical protein [Enterobacter hormaechei]
MATTPTNLPVPSESPRDLKFNAGKIDEFVTSMGWTYTDRFGNQHYTVEGINYLSQQAMAAFGYVILTGKTFTTGATINKPNEVLLNTADGEYYKWTGSFLSGPKVVPANSTPESTGGIGPGAWLSVGDTTARQYVDMRTNTFNVEYFGFKTGTGQDISKLLTAFNEAEELVFSNGDYYLDDFTMPNTAKCKKITVKPGSKIQMNGYNCIFNVKDNFTIDLSGGGIWHGGLKKALVTADAAVGAYSFTVDDASVFQVGDMITTSFLIPDGDVNTWKWSNSASYGQFNYITAITGNTITVLNPIENRTLMRNVWVGNWRFGMAGLEFRGAGKARIIGGKMQEFKTYGLTCRNVDVTVKGTEITGMSIDCIYVIGTSSLTMRNFRFETCYDFGKLGIQHTSTGRVTLQNGYWRRGNFDADINHANQTSVTKFGKVILSDMTCVATPTLPLSGDQVDTITGQTANQLFGNRVNPARIFCSASYATTDFNSEGFEAINTSFLDYQRVTYGVEGSYGGNITIDSLVLRDVITTGSLFHLQVASGKTVIVRAHELRNLSVTRKYTVNYYPLFYVSGGFFSFSGLLKYDNGGYVGVDHRIETENAYIPEMEIVGSGNSILVSPTFIDALLVRSASVTKMGTGQRNDFTSLVLLQGGTISGDLKTSPSRLQRLRSVDVDFNANDSTTWVTLYTNTDSLTSVDVRIQLAPRKTINASAGIIGTIGAKLNKTGTSTPVVTNASTYLSAAAGNIAFWEGKVIGTQGAIADGTVALRCLSSGEVQININSTSLTNCTAFVAGA